MDLTTHDQLPDLVVELKTRWPDKFAVVRYQTVTQLPIRPPAIGTVLLTDVSGLTTKAKAAGYWHRGFPGLDAYWRV